jgi:hypothetical protein
MPPRPSNFEVDLKRLEKSHRLFKGVDQIEALADSGEFNAVRFCELRDFLLARAHGEPNDELVFVLNHVGEAAFGLQAKTPEEAFAQATKSQAAMREAGTMQKYAAKVDSLGAKDSQKPHLPLAQEIADRHLKFAVWSILFARKAHMTDEQFIVATGPYLASIVSDKPEIAPHPRVQGQAEADNALNALDLYFGNLADGLRSSSTLMTLSPS